MGKILNFPIRLGETDRDMVELEIASLASMQKVMEFRNRVGKIVGADYMFQLLEYLFSGKPVLPEGFDPTQQKFPHQYAHHLDLMDERELELLYRTISVVMKKIYGNSTRSRQELFYLRTEIIRRIAHINGTDVESIEMLKFAAPGQMDGERRLRSVK